MKEIVPVNLDWGPLGSITFQLKMSLGADSSAGWRGDLHRGDAFTRAPV